MNVSGVSFGATPLRKPNFQARERQNEEQMYENPISRSTERNLAILKSTGWSAVMGAIAGGLTTCMIDTKQKGYVAPLLMGGAVMLGTLLFTLPSKLYGAKVGAFTREKEMDVFARDRALKSNLTEEVHSEVQDQSVSLDKKLDDNLKLQMANRGNAVGLANLTPGA